MTGLLISFKRVKSKKAFPVREGLNSGGADGTRDPRPRRDRRYSNRLNYRSAFGWLSLKLLLLVCEVSSSQPTS